MYYNYSSWWITVLKLYVCVLYFFHSTTSFPLICWLNQPTGTRAPSTRGRTRGKNSTCCDVVLHLRHVIFFTNKRIYIYIYLLISYIYKYCVYMYIYTYCVYVPYAYIYSYIIYVIHKYNITKPSMVGALMYIHLYIHLQNQRCCFIILVQVLHQKLALSPCFASCLWAIQPYCTTGDSFLESKSFCGRIEMAMRPIYCAAWKDVHRSVVLHMVVLTPTQE